MAPSRVAAGSRVGISNSARMSSGPVPTMHTNLVPPASMPPYRTLLSGSLSVALAAMSRRPLDPVRSDERLELARLLGSAEDVTHVVETRDVRDQRLNVDPPSTQQVVRLLKGVVDRHRPEDLPVLVVDIERIDRDPGVWRRDTEEHDSSVRAGMTKQSFDDRRHTGAIDPGVISPTVLPLTQGRVEVRSRHERG